MTAATYAEDRSLVIPPNYIVTTGYVAIHKVRLACRERMAVGDVGAAYQRLLQLGDGQRWPCPNGYWEGDTFVIKDGRHEYVASLMLGKERLLVAWAGPDT